MASQKPYVVVYGVPETAPWPAVESLIREIFGLYPDASLGGYEYSYTDIRKRLQLLDERTASMVVMRHHLHGNSDPRKRVTMKKVGEAHGLSGGGRVRQILARTYTSLQFWLPFTVQMRRVNRPLSDIDLPVQVFRAFLGAGIESLDQLEGMTREDVLQILRHHDAKQKKHVFDQLEIAGAVPPWTRDVEGTLESLRLSPRPYNALKLTLKIDTIDQLCELTEEDLQGVRNLGVRSVEEIKQKLEVIGRHLKQ